MGVLGASRSVLAVNPEMNYGIALLMTGPSNIAGDAVLDIFRLVQPALDSLLAKRTADIYSGRWTPVDDDGEGKWDVSEVNVEVEDGSLWITKLVLNGTDVLRMTQGISENDTTMQEAVPVTMWSTGRHHEFRSACSLSSSHPLTPQASYLPFTE